MEIFDALRLLSAVLISWSGALSFQEFYIYSAPWFFLIVTFSYHHIHGRLVNYHPEAALVLMLVK